ncbi:TetR/AcrR family transcriptional regulator [Lichenicoccus roseus]|uniref:TetR/AcrR family transcriptional regulator n=1 Tax=Lichenicoccus roseus TaxID=2683649 RepID=A0A5R9J7J8_9PROT|nr:TetR/AcrR family transcriptional regulator [Lichenicoccus roseus]TLU71326.1 TetR/AcrR family transcriptional regulator [Lichenicoccus roseus]
MSSGAAQPAAASPATTRYLVKRGMIVDAASTLINEHGVKGLSLAEVASAIGLSNTSITYYFRRKDELAAACFDRALDLLEQQVAEAGLAPDPSSRIRSLVRLSFEAAAASGRNMVHPVVRLNDLRATEDPARAALVARYVAIVRRAREFFGVGGGEEEQLLRLMRTHVLLDNLYVLPSWLEDYAPEELGRVQARLVEMLENGLAPRVRAAEVVPPALPAPRPDDPGERFLGAATRLINERGYRGTSVDRISARLNVTKGSFYHHLDGKDDLVLECFRRSLDTVTQALDAALAAPGNCLSKLDAVLSALLSIQLSDSTPLLRTTALLALPAGPRREVIERSERITRRWTGLLIDTISEGSIAPVDPLIAGRVLMSTINAAYELRARAARVPERRAVALYGSTLFDGLLDGGG